MSDARGTFIIGENDLVLVTGATGFIGAPLVRALLELCIRRVRCLVKATSDTSVLERLFADHPGHAVELITGNLLSRADCAQAVKDVRVVFHLATGRDGRSF